AEPESYGYSEYADFDASDEDDSIVENDRDFEMSEGPATIDSRSELEYAGELEPQYSSFESRTAELFGFEADDEVERDQDDVSTSPPRVFEEPETEVEGPAFGLAEEAAQRELEVVAKLVESCVESNGEIEEPAEQSDDARIVETEEWEEAVCAV